MNCSRPLQKAPNCRAAKSPDGPDFDTASIAPGGNDGCRPRERLRALGVDSLQTSELLALVLRTGGSTRAGLPRVEVVPFAEDLLRRFDGLQGLFDQTFEELLSVPGLGPAKAAGIVAARELARRAALANVDSAPVLAGSTAVQAFLRQHLAGLQREVFGLLLLNTRQRLLAVQDLFHGSIDRAQVYPREVVRACLEANAASVVVYHNHPSGHAEPSASDIELTRRLKTLLEAIDVRLLDHVVVGGSSAVSLAERGVLG